MKYLVEALRHPRDYDWKHLRPWQRHSQVLAVGGLVYLLIGVAFITMPNNPDRNQALSVILQLAPLQFWGACWAIAGVMALISTRWPPPSKTWGYTALAGVAALWSSAYLVGILDGNPVTGVLGSLVYGLFGFLWWAIAGLSNPDDLHTLLPAIEEPAPDHPPEA